MSQFITDPKSVKIRKPRKCEFCFKRFEVKSEMVTWAFTDMGKMWSYYCCNVCNAFMNTLSYDDLEDEIGDHSYYPDSYPEFVKNYTNKQEKTNA